MDARIPGAKTRFALLSAHDDWCAPRGLMRPTLLNPLFALVTSLPGVGPKQDRLLRYLLGRDETPRLVDLLLHLPASVIDRRPRARIRDVVPGTVVTPGGTVDRPRPTPARNHRAPHLVCASDDTGGVVLTDFRV